MSEKELTVTPYVSIHEAPEVAAPEPVSRPAWDDVFIEWVKAAAKKLVWVGRRIVAIARFIPETMRQKKELVLSVGAAKYVESLFMGGAGPEDIARAMNARYGRERWNYFRVFDPGAFAYVFKNADLHIDGLEYIRSALVTLGGIVVKKDGDYYQAAHPMVQKIAGIAAHAALPKSVKE